MKTKVTKQGLFIPKEFLEDAEEVDIRVEGNRLIIVPVPKVDPILDFGTNPVSCGISDASERHDKYLYGTD